MRAAALPVLFALGTLLYVLAYHEPWRDEAHTLVFAREVPLTQLLAAAHVEGAPPLFHLLLKTLSVVFSGPVALALGNAIGFAVLLYGTQQVMRAMDVPRAVVAVALGLLVCTDAVTYEFGVIARPYGLALGFAFSAIASLLAALDAPRPRRLLVRAGLLAGAATLTTTHGGCVAAAALVAYFIAAFVRGERRHALIPLAVFLPSFLLDAWIISDANRVALARELGQPTWPGAATLAKSFFDRGLGPTRWWFYSEDYAAYDARAVEKPLVLGLVIAAVRGAFVSRVSARRVGVATLLVIASWVPLLYIFVFRYGGWFRHWLHLWLPAIVLAIGALLHRPRSESRLSNVASIVGLLCFGPWWLGQWWALRETLSRDRAGFISETMHVAPLLPRGARVVGTVDWVVEPLLLWRPDLVLRSSSGRGRYFRYIVPDALWTEDVPYDGLVREECRTSAPVYLVSPKPIEAGGLARVEHPQRVDAWDHFEIYAIDCARW